MISIDETFKKWSDANSWCSNYGSGWYMPSITELSTVYSKKSYINSILSTLGKTTLSGKYWSAIRYDNSYYYIYNMDTGYSDSNGHYSNTYYVRVVREF